MCARGMLASYPRTRSHCCEPLNDDARMHIGILGVHSLAAHSCQNNTVLSRAILRTPMPVLRHDKVYRISHAWTLDRGLTSKQLRENIVHRTRAHRPNHPRCLSQPLIPVGQANLAGGWERLTLMLPRDVSR